MHSDLFDPRRGAPHRVRRGWDPTLRKDWSPTEDWFFRGFPAYFVTGILLFLTATFLSILAGQRFDGWQTLVDAFHGALAAGLVLFALLPAGAAVAASPDRTTALTRALVVTVPGTAFCALAGLLPLAGASAWSWGEPLLHWGWVAGTLLALTVMVALLVTVMVGVHARLAARRARLNPRRRAGPS